MTLNTCESGASAHLCPPRRTSKNGEWEAAITLTFAPKLDLPPRICPTHSYSREGTRVCRRRLQRAEKGNGVLPERPSPASAGGHVCRTQRHATLLHEHIELFLNLVSSFSLLISAAAEEGWQDLLKAS